MALYHLTLPKKGYFEFPGAKYLPMVYRLVQKWHNF